MPRTATFFMRSILSGKDRNEMGPRCTAGNDTAAQMNVCARETEGWSRLVHRPGRSIERGTFVRLPLGLPALVRWLRHRPVAAPSVTLRHGGGRRCQAGQQGRDEDQAGQQCARQADQQQFTHACGARMGRQCQRSEGRSRGQRGEKDRPRGGAAKRIAQAGAPVHHEIDIERHADARAAAAVQ